MSPQWPASAPEERELSDLRPWENNARTHSDAQVAKIAASITEWGWTSPVLVNEADQILAGHGRVEAAKLLGIDRIPVIVARDWTPAQQRAYVIADNQLALEAGWDADVLALELKGISEMSFDLSLVGFEPADLSAIMSEDKVARAVDLGVPTVEKLAVSTLGDRWILGDHIVVCGSSGDADVWGDVQVKMVWTDPPYGIDYVGKTADALTIKNDGAEGLAAVLDASLRLAASHCIEGGPWYVCAPAGPQFLDFGFLLKGLGIWRQTITWVKDVFVLGRSDFHYRHEPIFYGWNPGDRATADECLMGDTHSQIIYGWTPGAAHRYYGDRKMDTVWEIPRPKRSADHPTMKPLPLIVKSLEASSLPGDLVADPFGGSGSTLIACEATDRKCFTVEIDPLYVDVIVRRWQHQTGNVGVLMSTGETFDEREQLSAD